MSRVAVLTLSPPSQTQVLGSEVNRGKMEMSVDTTAFIAVEVRHNPAAVFYRAFTPTITINGRSERRSWGHHRFEVPAGDCEVSVSYPWIIPECGRNSVRFSIAAGETKQVKYCARFIRFIPGKISVM